MKSYRHRLFIPSTINDEQALAHRQQARLRKGRLRKVVQAALPSPVDMSSYMTPQRPAFSNRPPSLSVHGSSDNGRRMGRRSSSSAQMRSKFAVSYESLLSGDLPWLGTGPGASSSSSSSSMSGTPISASAHSPGPSSALSSPASYFSSKGKKPSAPRSRFFADLLCLQVEPATLGHLLDRVPASALVQDDIDGPLARVRDNIGSLWRECLRVWTDSHLRQPDFASPSSNGSPGNGSPTSPRDVFSSFGANGNANGGNGGGNRRETDEVRRANAAETLVLLSKAILAKKAAVNASSSSLDLIWVFAGGIDEADDIFESLVNAIDDGLRGHLDKATHPRPRATSRASGTYLSSTPTQESPAPNARDAADLPTAASLLFHRRRALQLAIVWISHISANSLSAYFVRRDLFGAAGNLLAYLQNLVRSARAQSVDETLADEDAILFHNTIRDTTLLIGLAAGVGQGGLASGAGIGPSFQGGLDASFSPYFRRMCDWRDELAMLCIQDAMTLELQSTWRAYEDGDAIFAANSNQNGFPSSFGFVTEGLKKFSLEAEKSREETLPPASAALILPLFLLNRANHAFVNLAFAVPAETRAEDGPRASFSASLLSTTSYLATHGSLNHRARVYSRLAMLVYLTLMSSNAGVTALLLTERRTELSEIKQCKQRSGPLPIKAGAGDSSGGLSAYLPNWTSAARGAPIPQTTGRKRLLPYVLDCCVQYMRHNLRKKLDSSGYLICLHVIQLSIQQCAQHRIALEFGDWSEVWRACNSLAAFLAGRHSELLGVEIGKLAQALIGALSTAVVESDRFMESKKDIDILVYELVRSAETLRRLATLVATGTVTNGKLLPSSKGDGPGLPSKVAIVNALPSWRMLDVLFTAFDEKLRAWYEKGGDSGIFGLSFSLGAWTAGYLGKSSASTSGTNTPTSASESGSATTLPQTSAGNIDVSRSAAQKALPSVHTVMEIIASLDLEQIVQRGKAEHRNGSSPVDESWIEQAETQCLAEAFRYAAEDVRALVLSGIQ